MGWILMKLQLLSTEAAPSPPSPTTEVAEEIKNTTSVDNSWSFINIHLPSAITTPIATCGLCTSLACPFNSLAIPTNSFNQGIHFFDPGYGCSHQSSQARPNPYSASFRTCSKFRPSFLKQVTWHSRRGVDTLNKGRLCFEQKQKQKGHLVVFSCVCDNTLLALYILQISTPESRDLFTKRPRDNNSNWQTLG